MENTRSRHESTDVLLLVPEIEVLELCTLKYNTRALLMSFEHHSDTTGVVYAINAGLSNNNEIVFLMQFLLYFQFLFCVLFVYW